MRRLSLVIVGCASIGNWGCQMQPNRGDAVAPMLEVLPVEHLPEYIAGFPVFVALSVRGGPNVTHNLLTFANFTDLGDHIGLTMVGHDGREVVRHEPSTEPGGDERPSGSPLGPGETRRMLIDISPLIPSTIDAGDYDIRLTWGGVDHVYAAPPTTIRMRTPTSAELAHAAAAAPDRDRYSSWAAWTSTCSDVAGAPGRITQNDPLAFNVIVRRLFCSPVGPDQVNIDELSSLGDLFAPERDALKVELYQARGNTVEANRLMAELSRSQPGLAWWLRILERGRGAFIASYRRPVPPQK